MPNKRYISGRRFEWKIRDVLKYYNHIVIRSAGSKSVFDLVTLCWNSVRPIPQEPRTLNDFNFEFYIGFWQLKKSITHKQASKLLREILNNFNLNSLNNIKTEELIDIRKKKKIADLIYWQGITEDKKPNKYKLNCIRIGVIYTLPKKRKLEKKNRIIKVDETLKGGEKVVEASSG